MLPCLNGCTSARTLWHTNQRDSSYLPCKRQDRNALEGWVNLSTEKCASAARRRPRMPRFGMVRVDGARRLFALARGLGYHHERRISGPAGARATGSLQDRRTKAPGPAISTGDRGLATVGIRATGLIATRFSPCGQELQSRSAANNRSIKVPAMAKEGARMIAAIKQIWNRLFPLRTHCQACGKELSRPSRSAPICWKCDAW